jgi:hypothetical protein
MIILKICAYVEMNKYMHKKTGKAIPHRQYTRLRSIRNANH